MMLYNVLVAFLGLLALAATHPTNDTALATEVGLPGAIYICTEPDWKGQCFWRRPDQEASRCVVLQTPARSIGPDPGGYCIIYAMNPPFCQVPLLKVYFPGAITTTPFQKFMCFKGT